MTKAIKIGNVTIGGTHPLALIAGPCVMESDRKCLGLARRLASMAEEEKIPFIFKASYDKANRSSHQSYRGPGLSHGLDILSEIKERFGVPVLTDVHNEMEVPLVSKVADVLQCPAFLCRQTDLLLALGECGKPVNIKKGQFMAPESIEHVVAKIESTRNRNILITERGTTFGYHNLVVDMRGLAVLREFGYPVVFDATHSVQMPGGAGNRSGGDSRHVPCLARAAVAAGCDAVFIETHMNPKEALSDQDSMIPFSQLRSLWRMLKRINECVHKKV